MDVSNLADLVKLTAKAWSIPILAQFGAGVPGRQAPLLKATGAGRTAFGQSLTHLQDLGLVERNPGHGHPMRPEYRLTAAGKRSAGPAQRLWELCDGDPLIRRQWSVPLLVAAHHPCTFSQLRRHLSGISDRALSHCLQQLQANMWLVRTVDTAARPPRPIYQSDGLGSALAHEGALLLQGWDDIAEQKPQTGAQPPVARLQ